MITSHMVHNAICDECGWSLSPSCQQCATSPGYDTAQAIVDALLQEGWTEIDRKLYCDDCTRDRT